MATLSTALPVILGTLLSQKMKGGREGQCWGLFVHGRAVSRPLQPNSFILHRTGNNSSVYSQA